MRGRQQVSSGEPWTAEEEERLRQAWVELVMAFTPHRSSAALLARVNTLHARHYHQEWPWKTLNAEGVEETPC